MKLGVHVGYWGLGLSAEDQLALVQEAERLGYDSVWTAEAYGSDAATIVMLTGASGPQAERGALDAGADLFLTKPFSPLHLLRLVDRIGAT